MEEVKKFLEEGMKIEKKSIFNLSLGLAGAGVVILLFWFILKKNL